MDQDEAIEYLRQKKAADTSWQNLCKMCGKCCRLAVPQFFHDELEELSESGDIEAQAFLNIFEPYASIEAAKFAVPDHFEKIVNELSKNPDFDINKFTFYRCKHITDKNLCSMHETRPECCRRAPCHGWSLFPPDCGFEGWQFEQRENHKRVIRNLKEILHELDFYKDDDIITEDKQTAKELREKIIKKIEPWNKYGAENW